MRSTHEAEFSSSRERLERKAASVRSKTAAPERLAAPSLATTSTTSTRTWSKRRDSASVSPASRTPSPDLPSPYPFSPLKRRDADSFRTLDPPDAGSLHELKEKRVGFREEADRPNENELEDYEENQLSVVISPRGQAPSAHGNMWTTIPSPLIRNPSSSPRNTQVPANSGNGPQDLFRSLLSDIL